MLFCFDVYIRLLRIHQGKQWMLLSNTSRICSVHRLHCSSTPCMILTVKELISSVDTLSVYVKVFPLLFPMVSGSTSLITMPLPNSSSLRRGTLGELVLCFLCLVRKFQMLVFAKFLYMMSGMWTLSWLFRRERFSQCVVWTWLSTVIWLDQLCNLVSCVWSAYWFATTICGLVGASRYSLSPFPWNVYVAHTLYSWLYGMNRGDLWPLGIGSEDRFAIHLPQQSEKPVCDLKRNTRESSGRRISFLSSKT